MHAFRSGITDAAAALKSWSDWQAGRSKGRRVEFPKPKKKGRCTDSVSFVEINHQLSWLHPDRHHVRLMLPRASPDPDVRRRRAQLGWLHTVGSTANLYRVIEAGKATIQKVTIAKRGGRWQASFLLRYHQPPHLRPVKGRGRLIAVDAGVRHLLTTSEPVPGLTDEEGHIASPKILDSDLRRLQRLDRALSRTKQGSNNRRKVLRRRARLHGRIVKTRRLCLHQVTTALAGAYDTVAVEDLNVKGMADRRFRLGRALAEVSLGELRRQLTYKTAERGHTLLAVGRFYPSSKTCSACGEVKATLPLSERVFRCDKCGNISDRDVNAAQNIAREAARLLDQPRQQSVQQTCGTSPGYDRETLNADRRPRKTKEAGADMATVACTAEPGSPLTSGWGT